MKKTFVRVVALSLIAVMMVCVLASCGKTISGTYEAKVGVEGLAGYTATYTFSGKKVTAVKTAEIAGFEKETTLNGTYEITENDDGELQIKISFETEDDDVKSGIFPFSEGEEDGVKYIKIAGIKYTEKK